MSSYSLDDLRAALDDEFKPLEITVAEEAFVLQNLLRLDKKRRDAVLTALKTVEESTGKEDDETTAGDMEAMIGAVNSILLAVVADNRGKKLVGHLDGDLFLTMKVLGLWMEATKAGEAQPSSD